jgi:hypothetical protein
VDIEFSPDADGTRVTLIHTGWEAPGVAVCGLQVDYTGMWSAMLEHFFFGFVAEQMLLTV